MPRLALPCLAAAAALAAAGSAHGPPAAAAPPARAGETTLTARVVVPTVARRAPRPGARPRMRLVGLTAFSARPQRLMVTGRHRDRRGHGWVRVQLPVRPNGANGWVRAAHVRLSGTRTRFVVRIGARRFEIWRGARRVLQAPAGVGRPGTPTPIGRFAIQDPVRTHPGWRSVYGAWTLTLTAHSPVLKEFMGGPGLVAIHGTGSGRRWRVGRASSFGCVILSEPALAIAARHARPGTPVIIRR